MSENKNGNFYLDLTKPEPEPEQEPQVIILPEVDLSAPRAEMDSAPTCGPTVGADPVSARLQPKWEPLLHTTPEADWRAAAPCVGRAALGAPLTAPACGPTVGADPVSARREEPRPQQRQTLPPLRPVAETRGRRGRGKKVFVGGVSRFALAALLIFGLLLSSAVGFAGGLVASNLNQPEQPALAAADNGQTVSMAAQYAAARTSDGQVLTPAQVAAVATDSVVEIVTQTEVQVQNFGFWGWGSGESRTQIREGAGSGVILTKDGYIITNNHVIEDANKIQITLRNGESYEATLVATDSTTDVAVLKINATGLTAAVIGDSSALVVGEPAVVIGNPLGQLGGTVTVGYISALDRQINLDGQTMNLLQTDASINSGNSGGGLFNQYGELVGIVVAKSSGVSVEGLGFAIPINDVQGVIDDLISYGYARGRIALGVELISIDSERAMNYYRVEKLGVYINRVVEGSNAERAGLTAGDLLANINGAEITDGSQVIEIIQTLSVGDTLTVIYEREGAQSTVEIVMRETVPSELATTKTTS